MVKRINLSIGNINRISHLRGTPQIYKPLTINYLMRILAVFLLFIMILLLIVGIYVFWLNFPTNLEYNTYVANATSHLPAQSYQFYSNMRYVYRNITYEIAPECSTKKRENIQDAFEILEEQTSLRFFSVE